MHSWSTLMTWSKLFSAILCTTIVHSYKHTHISSPCTDILATRDCWFSFSWVFIVCYSYLGPVESNSLIFSNQTIRFISYFQTSFKYTLLSVSLSHFLGPCPPMRPDSVLDLGAIEIIYLLTVCLLCVLCCQYQCKWLPGKTRLRNDLLCVEQDVNLSSLTDIFNVLNSELLLGSHLCCCPSVCVDFVHCSQYSFKSVWHVAGWHSVNWLVWNIVVEQCSVTCQLLHS